MSNIMTESVDSLIENKKLELFKLLEELATMIKQKEEIRHV